MANGFGMDKKIKEFDDYIGKYVIIYRPGIQSNFSGLCVRIADGYAILNPFQGGEFDPEKGLVRKMIDGESMIPLTEAVIEPTTRENLENYCVYANKMAEEQRIREGEQSQKIK